ncbi:uncharacterized protein LOC117227999 isoform X1 [Megalopta genalis]|uniref:uncharacterized protein LOC117227999 isoform X1 n=1 Tax=Megalopta genalis TaxID=115081 RepID=UPI003FD2D8D4
MSHTKTKSEKRNVATQTHDTMLEIARLEEQVKLLTIENGRLSKNSVGESSISVRGCQCKSKCATKRCGCFRKNISCSELCKCGNSVCKNQKNVEEKEENLENIEVRNDQVEIKQIKNKNLIAPYKGLFSPDNTSTPSLKHYKLSPLQFSSRKYKLFKNDEEEETPEQIEEIRDEKKSAKHKTEQKNSKNFVTEKKNRQKNEVSSNHIRKLRSYSNEEKRKKKEMETEKETLTRCKSSEIKGIINDKMNYVEKNTNDYIQHIKDDMLSLRCIDSNKNVSCEYETQENDYKAVSKTDDKEVLRQLSKSIDQEQQNHSKSEILEDNFDPMKPKYELQRTPTNTDCKHNVESHSISPVPFPVLVVNQDEELPIPKEFNQAEVNWEEYQAQLVACNKCKRRFHPCRIQKHQACCKKV